MSDMETLIDQLLSAEQQKADYEELIRRETEEAQQIIDKTMDEYEPILTALDLGIKELRAEIRDVMIDTGDEKKRHGGKVVTLVRRPKLQVVDMTAAREWLTEQGQLAAFITLNSEKYIKEYPDGPGIGKRFTTFITVQEDRVT